MDGWRKGGTATMFVGLLLAAVACHAPGPWPCPAVDVAGRYAVSGHVKWSVGPDGGEQDVPLAGISACTATSGAGVQLSDDLGSSLVDESVAVECLGPTAGKLTVDVRLGDPRAWAVGSYPVTDTVRFQYADPCASCTGCIKLVEGGASVDVLSATGSAAPPPDVVTSDFERRFRVRFDLPAPIHGVHGTSPNLVECDFAAFMTFDIEFALERADFKPDMARMCSPEG